MAAYRAGIKTVVIPKDNEPDLEEVDPVVKAAINFVIADKIGTVLDTALVRPIPMMEEEKAEETAAAPVPTAPARPMAVISQ